MQISLGMSFLRSLMKMFYKTNTTFMDLFFPTTYIKNETYEVAHEMDNSIAVRW